MAPNGDYLVRSPSESERIADLWRPRSLLFLHATLPSGYDRGCARLFGPPMGKHALHPEPGIRRKNNGVRSTVLSTLGSHRLRGSSRGRSEPSKGEGSENGRGPVQLR